jgi:hypothetical protein
MNDALKQLLAALIAELEKQQPQQDDPQEMDR